MKIKESYVEVPGGSVFVKQWVDESAVGQPPLILLHDSLGSVDLWKDFPEVLAKTLSRTVIAYDRLGFGKSAARNVIPSLEFIEEEANTYFPAIKAQLDLTHYILVGYSVGGGMAINIAAKDKDCLAVISIAAQAYVEDRTVKGIRLAKTAFEKFGQFERLEKWHGSKTQWVLDAWTEVWLSDAFKNWSLAPVIGEVKCPTLVLHGDKDEYGTLAFPRYISSSTDGPSTLLIIDNCGHMPHKEHPDIVLSACKDFLEGFNLE